MTLHRHLQEIDEYCTGRTTNAPPVEVWVVCWSWVQSVAVQSRFWDLCDKAELHPDTVFEPAKGFKGKHPCVRYKNGSTVQFHTVHRCRLERLAGAHIDVALWVGRPDDRVAEELERRVDRNVGAFLTADYPPVGLPAEAGEAPRGGYALTMVDKPRMPESDLLYELMAAGLVGEAGAPRQTVPACPHRARLLAELGREVRELERKILGRVLASWAFEADDDGPAPKADRCPRE